MISSRAPEVVLTNAPAAPDRIDRRNAFLPLDQPVVVQPGDRIEVSLVIRPIDFVVSWRTCVRRGDRVLVDAPQSTLRGMLLTRDDLHWAANDHRPVLSRWAGARATVLALCDGRTPLADIEAALVERHRDLFASLHAAQVFAAEVISRYSDTARTE